MIKTYQYRIYPTIKQAKKLFAWLEMLRNLYNQALAWRKTVYTGESVSWVTQADALPDLKQASAPFASLHMMCFKMPFAVWTKRTKPSFVG